MSKNNGIRKLAFRVTTPPPKQLDWLTKLTNAAEGMSHNLGVGGGAGAIAGAVMGAPAPYAFNEYGQPIPPGYGDILSNSLYNALIGGAAGAAVGGGYYGINRMLSRTMAPSEIRLGDHLSTAIPLPKYELPTSKYISPGLPPVVSKASTTAAPVSTPAPKTTSKYVDPLSPEASAQRKAHLEEVQQAVARQQAELDRMRRSNPANFSQNNLPGMEDVPYAPSPEELAHNARVNQYEQSKADNERYLNTINEYRLRKSMKDLPGLAPTPSDTLLKNMVGIDPSNINDPIFRKMSSFQRAFHRDIEKTAEAKLRGIYATKD